jgi:hypothetical protein
MKPYGYGRYANVFTALEFERLSNATGPTGGKILMRDDTGAFTRPPGSVALLHCIGSRDVNYHEYCSRVCCMYALKYTHLIKEKVGHDTAVYDFYIDMRCFGEGYEEFYRRCQEEGTTFIRGKVAEITDQAQHPEEEGKLVAIGEDTLLGRWSACRWTWWCSAPPCRRVTTPPSRGAHVRRQPGCRRILSGGTPQAGAAEHGHRRCFSGRVLPEAHGYSRTRSARPRARPPRPYHWRPGARWRCPPPFRGSIRTSASAARCASICALMAAIEFDPRGGKCRWSIRRSARAAAVVRGSVPAGPPQPTFQEQADLRGNRRHFQCGPGNRLNATVTVKGESHQWNASRRINRR